jgi:hypothetical protein
MDPYASSGTDGYRHQAIQFSEEAYSYPVGGQQVYYPQQHQQVYYPQYTNNSLYPQAYNTQQEGAYYSPQEEAYYPPQEVTYYQQETALYRPHASYKHGEGGGGAVFFAPPALAPTAPTAPRLAKKSIEDVALRTMSDIRCKFDLSGFCRNGKLCEFAHGKPRSCTAGAAALKATVVAAAPKGNGKAANERFLPYILSTGGARKSLSTGLFRVLALVLK